MQYALALLLLTQSQSATEFVIPAAEEKFAADVGKAEADLAKIKQTAGAARLKVYKDKLSEATKAGDFDKATQIKARIESLESEPDAKAHKRPRPKNAVRFDGHAYALIKEPATWHVAKQRCEEMGGHLVCVNGVKEESFIASLGAANLCWIGATDEADEGKWYNVDGTRSVFSNITIDNSQGHEHWMSWDGVNTKKFNDWYSGGRLPYICEWDR